jgi:hypothetical protein
MLLGLLREASSSAAALLADAGVTRETARRALERRDPPGERQPTSQRRVALS